MALEFWLASVRCSKRDLLVAANFENLEEFEDFKQRGRDVRSSIRRRFDNWVSSYHPGLENRETWGTRGISVARALADS
jgi:hypothetical protein